QSQLDAALAVRRELRPVGAAALPGTRQGLASRLTARARNVFAMETDGLLRTSPAARSHGRRAVTGASAFIGVVAIGATGALVLGLAPSSSAATSSSGADQGTTQVPPSFGTDQQRAGAGPSMGGGPMASSGGS
ncbi:MAG: hypothetical protein QOJ48_1645, partial [Frankiales bacterium]|nr:hypothetical protein [Frankiales bacterium]